MAEQRRILRVALTGGIATGKSHCLRRISAAGIPTIDSDRLAREAVGGGTPGLQAVVARFGKSVLRADGQLDRGALAGIVFEDVDARRALEAIIHPSVFAAIQSWFARLEEDAAGKTPVPPPTLGVADIPLLFETGSEGAFDVVVVAVCEPAQAITRLMARDGLDEATARRRVAVQLPISEKRARADYVIDTSGSVAETDQRIDQVIRQLIDRT